MRRLSRIKNIPQNVLPHTPQTNSWRKVRPSFFTIDFAVFFTLLFALTLATLLMYDRATFITTLDKDIHFIHDGINKARQQGHVDQLWLMLIGLTIIVCQAFTYIQQGAEAWSVKEECMFSPEFFEMCVTSLGFLWCMLFLYPLVITWAHVGTHLIRQMSTRIKNIFARTRL